MEAATTIRGRLEQDLKSAMRAGDTTAREAIRFVLAALKNAEIEKRSELTDAEAVAVIQRQVKQRQDSIEQFKAGGRDDLVERESGQLAVVERYLPSQLGDDELVAMVREAVDEVGASSPKDMGKVMPVLLPRVAGRADGRRVSEAVRAALADR